LHTLSNYVAAYCQFADVLCVQFVKSVNLTEDKRYFAHYNETSRSFCFQIRTIQNPVSFYCYNERGKCTVVAEVEIFSVLLFQVAVNRHKQA